MTNVSMAMEAALRLIPPDDNELRKLILLTKEQARDGLKETRDALYRLRQHEVETIRGLQAVRKLASIFEQITGIHVKQDYSNVNGSFGDDVDRFLFRFVQEGLVNAFKHAKPTEIDIYFHLTDNILHVHIADNGRGCTALKEGIGMQGIRERLSRLGGELNLHCDSSGFAPVSYTHLPQTTFGLCIPPLLPPSRCRHSPKWQRPSSLRPKCHSIVRPLVLQKLPA